MYKKKYNEKEKIEDPENKWEQVKRKKAVHKQPNPSSTHPSISFELHPLPPKANINSLASLNPFEPLDPSVPPSPRPISKYPRHTPYRPPSLTMFFLVYNIYFRFYIPLV